MGRTFIKKPAARKKKAEELPLLNDSMFWFIVKVGQKMKAIKKYGKS